MLIYPFNLVFQPKSFSSSAFLFLQLFSAVIGVCVREDKRLDMFSMKFSKNLYKKYIICESSIFIFLLTLFIAFVKNIYESVGPMYEDIFFKLIEQSSTYSENYGVFITYIKKYLLSNFISSLLFAIVYYKLSLKTFMFRKTIFKVKLNFKHLPLIYLLPSIYLFSQIFIPLPAVDQNSLFFKNAVIANSKPLTFPENKKNIIVITAESMDSTFYSLKNGGITPENLVPFFEELALNPNYTHFSHQKKPLLGGMKTTSRSCHTMGSAMGAVCGIPFMGENEVKGRTTGYMKELTCIGELLVQGGYTTSSTFGCPFNDWGIGYVFKYHDFQRINTNNDMVGQKERRFWINDYASFEYFKNEVTQLSKGDKPFFAFFATLDAHEPGFICPYCPQDKYPHRIWRSVKCTDNNLKKFMMWAKEQPWYKNTVIVIYGDHVSRSDYALYASSTQNYERGAFNVFINSELKSNNTFERNFSVYDMFPTILASAGIKIKGDKLGIGVNMFSDEKTHIEQYSQQEFEDSFNDATYWFDTAILNKPAQCDGFAPCISAEKIDVFVNVTIV
ncbi:Sulfatase family protein [Trichomonas vaginalis G3]|uniref:Sulfatase family protein n=1 Tax=Trichomonas vaginalis (strain ATCC PRA-98 / G3) TaxID=412133 RepID=A2EPI9_TRIV3|nr:lipoteichoic acid synthase family [Trichomonas vaginalis G3]EAY05418.1 Sulfatase family protein [Trichomonas vaginalis G3]KAI5523857.1 lipoteichoic acid synthase family [Trichomonas vaginalis G3]|eukprot:XP_001317641.1 Sulfatase family protein [Trichomonas vaginalis G3]